MILSSAWWCRVHGLWHQTALDSNPSSANKCFALGKLFNITELSLLCVQNAFRKKTTPESCWEEWRNMYSIYLSQCLTRWKSSVNGNRYYFSNYHYCLFHNEIHLCWIPKAETSAKPKNKTKTNKKTRVISTADLGHLIFIKSQFSKTSMN